MDEDTLLQYLEEALEKIARPLYKDCTIIIQSHGDFRGQTVFHEESFVTASAFSAEAVDAIQKIAEATALSQEQKDALTDLINEAKQAKEEDDDNIGRRYGKIESCKNSFTYFLRGAGEIVKDTLKTILPPLILAFFGLSR